jgi:hypothetical protein
MALGFWLLFLAFERSSILHGVAGGLAVLGAMYLMTAARKNGPATNNPEAGNATEDDPGDTIDGSGQGDKLPP